ncbi:MAG: GH25 family lysozyme [bacterium]|nr:GH25 family lysozyme [bacterium]
MKRIMKRLLVLMLIFTMILSGFTGTTKKAQAATKAIIKLKVTVKHPNMNQVKLKWNKISDAYGYNVYYKASASDTYQLVSSTLENQIVFDSLKSDKFYYFMIEAYKVEDGKQVAVGSSGDLKVRSNKIGIDVSKWNGNIDWKKVKAAGVEYAIVRVSYTTSTTAEKYYKKNIEGAQAVGIPVGVYTYSMATTEEKAKQEAEYVLNLIKGYKLQYPVAFDIEDKVQAKQGKTKAGIEKNTNLTKTFCEIIENAGYKAMIYTGCSFSRDYLNMEDLTAYDWWIAHYGSDEEYTHYTGKYHYGSKCNYPKTRFWQYSSLGTLSGVSGRFDMNYELDLKESVYGVVHYDIAKMQETYITANGETLAQVADKYNVSVNQLISSDDAYDSSSILKKGNKIVIDSKALASKGAKVSTVSNVKAVNAGYESIKLTWSPINYSNGYYIYRSTSKNGTYTKVAAVKGTTYTDKKLQTNKTYYYKVYGYKQNEQAIILSTQAAIVSAKPVLFAPSNVKISNTQYNNVTVKWSKVAGATEYKVSVATTKNGTYKKVGYTTGTSLKHNKLTLGKQYYYKVEAIRKVGNKKYWSPASKIISAKPRVATTKITKISTSSRKVTLTYSKISGASGYAVYRSTSKNGKYTRLIYTTKTSYKNSYLTRNKKYYYKVRAYRVVKGKKVYGSYSGITSVKVK